MLTNRYKQWAVGLFLSLAFVSVTTSAHATLFTFSETIRNDTFSGWFTLPDQGTLPLNFDLVTRPVGTIVPPYSLMVLLGGTDKVALRTFDIFRPDRSNFDGFGRLSALTIENDQLVAVTVLGNDGSIINFDGSAFFTLTVRAPLGNGFFATAGRNFPSRIDLVTSPVPEPSAALLFMTGLLGLAGYRWHQRRREGAQAGATSF